MRRGAAAARGGADLRARREGQGAMSGAAGEAVLMQAQAKAGAADSPALQPAVAPCRSKPPKTPLLLAPDVLPARP